MKRMAAWLLVLVLLLGLAGCSKAQRWQEQYDLGMRYLSEQNWEEAVLAFGEAIRIDPNRPEAYLGRGDAYRGRGGEGDLEAALADYAMARQLAGEDETGAAADTLRAAWENGVQACFDAGDWEGAVALLQQQLDAQGQTDGLLALLAERYLKIGEDGLIRPDDYTAQEVTGQLDRIRMGQYDDYYLTDAERQARLRPLLPQLEYFYAWMRDHRDSDPEAGDWESDGKRLMQVYYLLGEQDRTLEVREELFQLTGKTYYSPTAYSEQDDDSLNEYNAFGLLVSQQSDDGYRRTSAFSEDGRPLWVFMQYTDGRPDSGTEYLYEDGRLQAIYFRDGDVTGQDENGQLVWGSIEEETRWEYQYEDNAAVVDSYNSNGELSIRTRYFLNDFGLETGEREELPLA